jgi:hypothetical protein
MRAPKVSVRKTVANLGSPLNSEAERGLIPPPPIVLGSVGRSRFERHSMAYFYPAWYPAIGGGSPALYRGLVPDRIALLKDLEPHSCSRDRSNGIILWCVSGVLRS